MGGVLGEGQLAGEDRDPRRRGTIDQLVGIDRQRQLDPEEIPTARRAHRGAGHAAVDGGCGVHPADTQAGGEDFRHRAEADHPSAGVERLDRRHRHAVEADAAIGVVLDDDEVMFDRQCHKFSTPFERHGDAGRVVEIGNVEQEFWHRLAGGLPGLQLHFEQVRHHAVRVVNRRPKLTPYRRAKMTPLRVAL